MLHKLLITAALLLCSLSAMAQIEITQRDSLNAKSQNMIEQSETSIFNDANTPRFIITDKTQKFLFGVGGYLGAKAYYDFTGLRSVGFDVDKFAVPFRSSTTDKLGFGVTSSKIIFKLLGETRLGDIEVTFEIAVDDNYKLKLDKGYARIGNFLVGQDWSITSDVTTFPIVIDAGDPVAKFGYRIPLVRYMFKGSKDLKIFVALEFPSLVYNYRDKSFAVSELLPDFSTKFLFEPEGGIYTGQVSTILRYLEPDSREYPTIVPNRGFSYGITTSHQVRLGRHTLYAQASAGLGISDYFAGTSSHNLNVISSSFSGSDLEFLLPLWVWGGVGSYSYLWGKRSSSTLVASYLRVSDYGKINGTFIEQSTINSLFSVSVNYLHSVMENLTVGGELLYGNKSIYSTASAHGLRLGLLVRYDF